MATPLIPRTLITLCGPTSSGKTKLSVEIALRIHRDHGQDVTIISADSRQVYRYMDIGTSKTRPDEMRGIPHEMLDVIEPVRKLELEEYARLARGQIQACIAAGRVPFVVGGTGVYVKALVEAWNVEKVGRARESLRRDFPPAMIADAYSTLRRLDRAAASRVHPNNYEGVINALSRVVARNNSSAEPDRPLIRPLLLGVDPGQRALDHRVAATYDDQVRRGLLDEIRSLNARYDLERQFRDRGRGSSNQVLHTHGYREYFEVAGQRGIAVDGLTERDMSTVRSRVVKHIQGYTRRQRSWFRKLPGIRMVDSADHALQIIARTATSGC
ncbi:MAG: tRNA (adenosine(37)-N6)-dimethylallyltransferase [Pseudonocardiaceae bacterium]